MLPTNVALERLLFGVHPLVGDEIGGSDEAHGALRAAVRLHT